MSLTLTSKQPVVNSSIPPSIHKGWLLVPCSPGQGLSVGDSGQLCFHIMPHIPQTCPGSLTCLLCRQAAQPAFQPVTQLLSTQPVSNPFIHLSIERLTSCTPFWPRTRPLWGTVVCFVSPHSCLTFPRPAPGLRLKAEATGRGMGLHTPPQFSFFFWYYHYLRCHYDHNSNCFLQPRFFHKLYFHSLNISWKFINVSRDFNFFPISISKWVHWMYTMYQNTIHLLDLHNSKCSPYEPSNSKTQVPELISNADTLCDATWGPEQTQVQRRPPAHLLTAACSTQKHTKPPDPLPGAVCTYSPLPFSKKKGGGVGNN